LRSVSAACVEATSAEILAVLAELDAETLEFHLHDWLVLARDDQLPPPGEPHGPPWSTWLILGGRGAGKTRAGAEWVRAQALGIPPFAARPVERIALVGETMHDVRSFMVEGVSGLLSVHPNGHRPCFEPSRNQLVWPNGAIAQLFSAEDPDSLRGPQFGAAWADEIAKWRYGEAVWDMLQLALRLGDAPRAVATTTPRPVPLLRRLLADETVAVTRAKTSDNAVNLAPSFVAEMSRRFAGTVLGRQELDGELVEDVAGALWRRAWIETQRAPAAPELGRIVVAVDPPVTATEKSDACGIVIAGRGLDGRAYVLADRSLAGRSPDVWARAAVAAYRDFEADCIVAEVNQGGDLVAGVLRQVHAAIPVRKVRATRGKWIRAEPIAALYAEGRVVHVGTFDRLEDEMCAFGAGGLKGRSPDRMDALVWALTDLMLDCPERPGIRVL
jgi:phage terminase large subunit-like protein